MQDCRRNGRNDEYLKSQKRKESYLKKEQVLIDGDFMHSGDPRVTARSRSAA